MNDILKEIEKLFENDRIWCWMKRKSLLLNSLGCKNMFVPKCYSMKMREMRENFHSLPSLHSLVTFIPFHEDENKCS